MDLPSALMWVSENPLKMLWTLVCWRHNGRKPHRSVAIISRGLSSIHSWSREPIKESILKYSRLFHCSAPLPSSTDKWLGLCHTHDYIRLFKISSESFTNILTTIVYMCIGGHCVFELCKKFKEPTRSKRHFIIVTLMKARIQSSTPNTSWNRR